MGRFCGTASRCVPRSVRPPPASSCPQRHHATTRSSVSELGPHSLCLGRGCVSPSADTSSASRGVPKRAGHPERGQDLSVKGTPPTEDRAWNEEALPRGAGPNLPELGALQVHCLPGPPPPPRRGTSARGVRLRAAHAGRTPSAQSRPTRTEPQRGTGTRAKPPPSASRRPQPSQPAPNLYLKNPRRARKPCSSDSAGARAQPRA